MRKSDEFNLQLAASQEDVDKINSEFYGRFIYPWPPQVFEAFTEQQFGVTMLNQDIGSWDHKRIPQKPKVWVAGCGTNQAVYTALRFPESEVLGTDISTPSLEVCKNSADQLGIGNLTLEEKSINSMTCKDEFDYIICTGVIHHNADPGIPLKKQATALKPGGIIEIMLYNYYHTILMASFQKAIRLFCGTSTKIDMEKELAATKKIINHFPAQNIMYNFLKNLKNSPESNLASNLIQPVLHSYTVESFEDLVTECNLEILLPCINQFDKNQKRLTWNMKFNDAELAEYYEAFPDSQRWQLGNLLLVEEAPMIWFYLQRKDSPHKRKSEKEVCDEFLAAVFEKKSTQVKLFTRDNKGQYKLKPEPAAYPHPPIPTDPLAKKIYYAVNPGMTMKNIFHKLEIESSFYTVNLARVNLTTSAFPYLKTVV